MIFNIYSKITNKHIIKIIIDDSKKNVKEAQRVSLLYKIKLFLYTIISIIAITFFIVECFGEFDIISKLKIINLY